MNFSIAAISESDYWETPFEKMQVDDALRKQFLSNNSCREFELPHEHEHTLEMQTVFLSYLYPNSSIVPILISNLLEETKNSLVNFISSLLDETTILVVSTDFSHYPTYETANIIDRMTIDAIVNGDLVKFQQTITNIGYSYPEIVTAACGWEAVRIALRVAKECEIYFQLIKYENSGDISGQHDQVVGYGAISGVIKS